MISIYLEAENLGCHYVGASASQNVELISTLKSTVTPKG